MTIANGIQTGESTHHHDHEMTLVSLRTMNTMQSRPRKSIPPLWVELFVAIISLLKIKSEGSALHACCPAGFT